MEVIERHYYIKVNGKVYEVSKDKFKEFKKTLKDEKRKYLCPDCKVSNCNKIVYSNIKYCPEVSDATYVLEVHERTNSSGIKYHTNHIAEFMVFDCKQYKILSELLKKKSDSEPVKVDEEEQKRLKEEKRQQETDLMLRKILERGKN